ncbi:MAG: hypothetical protein RR427_10520, partial [Cellulosilyticaceae bacterium]
NVDKYLKEDIKKFHLTYKDVSKSSVEVIEELAGFKVSPVHLLDNLGTNLHIIYIVKEEEIGTKDETTKWDKLDQSRMMETIELVIPEAGNTRLKNLKFQRCEPFI